MTYFALLERAYGGLVKSLLRNGIDHVDNPEARTATGIQRYRYTKWLQGNKINASRRSIFG